MDLVCSRCGRAARRLPTASVVESHVRCTYCGHETWAIADGAAVRGTPVAWFRLAVAWASGRASAAQVARLRRLFPAVAARAIGDVVRSAGARPSMDLGTFPAPEAQRLVDASRAAGLDVRAVTVVGDDDEEEDVACGSIAPPK
jgi:hypothetical protein